MRFLSDATLTHALPAVISPCTRRLNSGRADRRLCPGEMYLKGVATPHSSMKLAGFLLLLSGWGIVLSAVSLLTAVAPRAAFVAAGIGVEAVGLVLVVRAFARPRGDYD